ncbi:fibronectin type III domain-containing protein [Flavobacterium adhaerens]|uniref:fibronectin type III domain-containing protein n=1 Tax=Flavobacterium adhaerens TaxID=3149043 RepID=UPI0032B353D6
MQNNTLHSYIKILTILRNQYVHFRLVSILLILLIIFLKSEKCFAQYAGHEQFQIYSPNTYSLGQYGDIPVNLSLGIPQIDVPIINFSDKDVNLNISISYHASGIKVDEEASWVGLGWVLNAGGVITREIRGLPDGFKYNGNLQERSSISDCNNCYDATSTQNYINQIKQNVRDGALNITDNGSDIFYYNFNGNAGKFFLDEAANATLTQYEDFKIQFVSDGATNDPLYTGGDFIITDEKGFVYEFKTHEKIYAISGGESYIGAWYISKITSPSGGQLIFQYRPGGKISSVYTKRCYSEVYFAVGENSPTHTIPNQYTNTCITRGDDINGIVLSKITSSSGNSLEFITSPNPRLDSESMADNQLDFIILKNKDNQQVKKFRFNYSYFEANNSKKIGLEFGNTIQCLNYRLRLDSFREIAVNGTEQSPYLFEYYGDNNPQTDDPYTLPYRLSPCQDHWGYYNNSFNKSIFPSNPQNKPFRIDDWSRELTWSGEYVGGINFSFGVSNGGTREPDTEATKACTLNKIVFPTGGFTSFEFETHSINYENSNYLWQIAGGLRVKQILTKEGTNSAPIIKNYEYLDYMSSEKCASGADNEYYTWYNSGYDPLRPDREGDWRKLAAFGVPAHLSVNNRFVVRVDGAPQLRLGAGTNAIYTVVKEISAGNGSTVYNFSFAPDFEFGGDFNFEGVSLPGLFNSALVQTDNIGTFLPTFHPKSISSCTFPFPNFLNNDWRRGHLLSKETYSEDGILMFQNSTEYDIRALKAVPGYKVTTFGDEIQYFYARYYDIGGMAKPIRQVTKMYNPDGSYLRTVKELDYSSPYHKQLTESKEYDSKGGVIATKYYYPTDYGNSLSSLKTAHILTPVDIRSYHNAKLISGKQVQYGTNGLPLAIYSAEPTTADIVFNSQSPYTFSLKFSNTYNENNTLESQTITNGITSVFLWGYNKTQPIAKIENATYSQVSSYVTALQTASDNGTLAQSSFNSLRAALPSAMVTTYTYKPLIGMTSMTDPKGLTTYYEYDSFNRLQYVKDQDQNILQRYCYNYLGQQTDCSVSSWTTVYKNIFKSAPFDKQPCAVGTVGTRHVYSVPAGIYSSTVSQADADAKAVNEINTNGQTFANANGSCLTVPAVPTGLALTSATTTTLNFSWTAVTGATSYKIYRGGTHISTVTAPTTTGTLTGLTASTAYNVQVLATNASVDGPLCTSVSMSTLSLPAPTGLTFVSASPASINFSWTAVTGATGYKIFKDGVPISSVSTTTGSLTGLTIGTSYNIQVLAYNTSGDGALSVIVPMSTMLAGPTGLTLTSATASSLNFSWNTVTGATGYKIFKNGDAAVTTTGTSWSFSGLSASTTYTIRVLAYNSAGDGLSTSVGMSTSVSSSSLPAPTNLILTSNTTSSINFSWTAVAGATGYKIFKNGDAAVTTTGTSWTFSGLSASTIYSIRVVAYNSAGDGLSTSVGMSTAGTQTPTVGFSITSGTYPATTGTSVNATIQNNLSTPIYIYATIQSTGPLGYAGGGGAINGIGISASGTYTSSGQTIISSNYATIAAGATVSFSGSYSGAVGRLILAYSTNPEGVLTYWYVPNQ